MSPAVTTDGTMPLSHEDAGVLHRALESYLLGIEINEELEGELGITAGRPKVDLIEHLAERLALAARVWRAIEQLEYPLDDEARGLLVAFVVDAQDAVAHEQDGHPDDLALAKARLAARQQLGVLAERLVNHRGEA